MTGLTSTGAPQHAQQQVHPRYRTPFQGDFTISGMSYRQQFHQTAHFYRPMAQITVVTQVTGVAPVLGLLHNQVRPAEQDRVVYMDSGSTVRTARNKDLFRSLQISQRPIKMATNAGESMLLEDGETPFGMAALLQQHRNSQHQFHWPGCERVQSSQ